MTHIRRKRRKQTAVDIVMNELLWCGGELKSRSQIEQELRAEGHDKRLIDFYIFCLGEQSPTQTKNEQEPAP